MSESYIPPPPYDSAPANTIPSNQYGGMNSDLRIDERLSTRLSATRQNHVQTIITNHILPIVESRTEMGLSQTSIALLPVNTASSMSKASDNDDYKKPPSKVINIVSGHDGDDDLQHISLTSVIDTTQFWSQSTVVDELRRSLKERLSAHPDILKVQSKMQSISPPVPLPPQSPPKPRRFFSRRSSSKGQERGNTLPLVQTTETLQSRPKELVAVDVQPEEVCLRTQSDFGLYETLTRPALLIRVRVHG